MKEKAQKALAKIKGVYTGESPQFHKSFHFSAVTFYRRRRTMDKALNGKASNNLRHALGEIATAIWNKHLRSYEDVAWLAFVKERGVIACSEAKKMEDPVCLRMLGYALRHNMFTTYEIDHKIANPHMGKFKIHPGRYYYGLYASSAKPDEPFVKINLTADWGPATA